MIAHRSRLVFSLAALAWVAGSLTGCGVRHVPGSGTITVGGSIAGYSNSGLTLTLTAMDGGTNTSSTQTLAVPAGTTTFTFPTAYTPAPSTGPGTVVFVDVTTQPSAGFGQTQTCIATNAIGMITAAGNISDVQVTCVVNPGTSLQGLYQFYSDAAGTQPLLKWLALAPDGTYLFADIENNATCLDRGNGIDFGAYNWNSTTGNFQIVSALVDSIAPCGYASAAGIVDTSVVRTLSRSGSGAGSVLTMANTVSGVTTTIYLLPAASNPGTIVGAFANGISLDQGVTVFGNNGYYLVMNPQANIASGAMAGVEYGCYVAGSNLVIDTTCVGAVETAGTSGFSGGRAAQATLQYSTPDAVTLKTTLGNLTYTSRRFDPN